MLECKIKIIPDLNLAIPSSIIYCFSDKLKELSLEMHKLMLKKKGIGIAAPQSDYNVRLIVLSKEYFDGKMINDFGVDSGKFLCLVNPEFISLNQKQTCLEEGCLSLPSAIQSKIPRYEEILLTASNIYGSSFTFELNGMSSIIIQHEIDHLDGILYPFRLTNSEYQTILDRYSKYNLIDKTQILSFVRLVDLNLKGKSIANNYNYEGLLNYCLSQELKEEFVKNIWRKIDFINHFSV